jgi:hypothetical protein
MERVQRLIQHLQIAPLVPLLRRRKVQGESARESQTDSLRGQTNQRQERLIQRLLCQVQQMGVH